MRDRGITLPSPVRQKVAILGTEGMKWLADLDDLIESLEQEWQITVGAILEGGTEAYAQARARAFNPEVAVLVHGDAHNGNTLQNLSQNAQFPSLFKFIDPDGIIAEGAYDLGVLMREWIDELVADPVRLGCERCAYLSSLTGMETQAIWQWGFIQSLSTGLFLIQVGLEQSGVQMLKVAEAWAKA